MTSTRGSLHPKYSATVENYYNICAVITLKCVIFYDVMGLLETLVLFTCVVLPPDPDDTKNALGRARNTSAERVWYPDTALYVQGTTLQFVADLCLKQYKKSHECGKNEGILYYFNKTNTLIGG